MPTCVRERTRGWLAINGRLMHQGPLNNQRLRQLFGTPPMSEISIGEAARRTGLSVDTLRYYEKIKLIPRIARDPGGRRRYDERDLSQLRFVQRAQRCNFSLAEIAELMKLRRAEAAPRPQVQQLTEQKLKEIKIRLKDLERLQQELELLLNLCRGTKKGCPIIERLNSANGQDYSFVIDSSE